MPKKLDRCVKSVRSKIRRGSIKKTFKCDKSGKPNPRGKKRCPSNPYAICKGKVK